VFGGTTQLPGKLVSLFAPHTEIIRKGKAGKPNEFGQLVQVQEAENQIITHYEVYDQRPSDKHLLIPAVEVHQHKFGRVPRLLAADAGYYSRQRRKGTGSRREAGIDSEPEHAERRTAQTGKAALVQARTEVADRMRRAHQRSQATPRARALPLP
jgi:IS5 family transposase